MKRCKDAALTLEFISKDEKKRGFFMIKKIEMKKDGSFEIKLHKESDKKERSLLFEEFSYDDFIIRPIFKVKK